MSGGGGVFLRIVFCVSALCSWLLSGVHLVRILFSVRGFILPTTYTNYLFSFFCVCFLPLNHLSNLLVSCLSTLSSIVRAGRTDRYWITTHAPLGGRCSACSPCSLWTRLGSNALDLVRVLPEMVGSMLSQWLFCLTCSRCVL